MKPSRHRQRKQWRRAEKGDPLKAISRRFRSRAVQSRFSYINESTRILLDKNWLPSEDCKYLISLYETFWSPKVGQKYNGNKVIDHSVLIGNAEIEFYLWELAERLRNQIQEFFGVADLFIESLFLAALLKGGFHEAHADNERYVRDKWVPNHTPQRDYTAILYLNSDFGGGELCFPQHNLSISPNRGSLVAFPCTGDFIHAVHRVSRGIRYSMPVWFTKDRRFAVWAE
jgi:hypothetical protein